MRNRAILATALFALTFISATNLVSEAQAQGGYGQGQPADWQQFYYYPYVTYPHNYMKNTGSYNHMYYRYAPSQRIPVYNKDWYNFYPSEKPYYKGHHFILDVF